jgi:hypothetical protein
MKALPCGSSVFYLTTSSPLPMNFNYNYFIELQVITTLTSMSFKWQLQLLQWTYLLGDRDLEKNIFFSWDDRGLSRIYKSFVEP